MTWKTGTATGHEDLLEQFRRWITGYGTAAAAVAGSNTGDGTVTAIDTTIDTVTETWTLACTAGGATGTFSVVGSVTGALASATVGTPYTNAMLSFTINDGAADFIIGDSFTIATTIGDTNDDGIAWEQLKLDTSVTNETHLYLMGKGAGGTDEIFVNLRTTKSVANDWYNIRIRGATGFLSGQDLDHQPNINTGTEMSLWNLSMPYWFIANGRRFMIVAKVSTVYSSCYAGFILPYALPSEYPYPLVIGASNVDLGKRWSVANTYHRAFWSPNLTLELLLPDATWQPFANYFVSGGGEAAQSSYNVMSFAVVSERTAIDGSYVTLPFVMTSAGAGGNVYGELDGIFKTSGYGNASENVITVDGIDHLVVQNTYRTGINDYAAIKLA